jgi:hypothetical protein
MQKEGLQINNWAIASVPGHPVTRGMMSEVRDYMALEYLQALQK